MRSLLLGAVLFAWPWHTTARGATGRLSNANAGRQAGFTTPALGGWAQPLSHFFSNNKLNAGELATALPGLLHLDIMDPAEQAHFAPLAAALNANPNVSIADFSQTENYQQLDTVQAAFQQAFIDVSERADALIAEASRDDLSMTDAARNAASLYAMQTLFQAYLGPKKVTEVEAAYITVSRRHFKSQTRYVAARMRKVAQEMGLLGLAEMALNVDLTVSAESLPVVDDPETVAATVDARAADVATESTISELARQMQRVDMVTGGNSGANTDGNAAPPENAGTAEPLNEITPLAQTLWTDLIALQDRAQESDDAMMWRQFNAVQTLAIHFDSLVGYERERQDIQERMARFLTQEELRSIEELSAYFDRWAQEDPSARERLLQSRENTANAEQRLDELLATAQEYFFDRERERLGGQERPAPVPSPLARRLARDMIILHNLTRETAPNRDQGTAAQPEEDWGGTDNEFDRNRPPDAEPQAAGHQEENNWGATDTDFDRSIAPNEFRAEGDDPHRRHVAQYNAVHGLLLQFHWLYGPFESGEVQDGQGAGIEAFESVEEAQARARRRAQIESVLTPEEILALSEYNDYIAARTHQRRDYRASARQSRGLPRNRNIETHLATVLEQTRQFFDLASERRLDVAEAALPTLSERALEIENAILAADQLEASRRTASLVAKHYARWIEDQARHRALLTEHVRPDDLAALEELARFYLRLANLDPAYYQELSDYWASHPPIGEDEIDARAYAQQLGQFFDYLNRGEYHTREPESDTIEFPRSALSAAAQAIDDAVRPPGEQAQSAAGVLRLLLWPDTVLAYSDVFSWYFPETQPQDYALLRALNELSRFWATEEHNSGEVRSQRDGIRTDVSEVSSPEEAQGLAESVRKFLRGLNISFE